MKFFLTEKFEAMEEAIKAAGHEVVSDAAVWASNVILKNPASELYGHPREYPLDAMARERSADVAILIDPNRLMELPTGGLNEFGYFRGYARQLKRLHVSLIMYAHDDPVTWDKFSKRMFRDCVCTPTGIGGVHGYITSSDEVLEKARKITRAAGWKPGETFDRPLAMINHGRGGHIFSPKHSPRW